MYVYIPFFVLHNAIFRKDYTILVGRLHPFNPFFEDSSIKIGADIVLVGSYELSLIISQKYVSNSTKNLLIHCFSGAKKLFLIQLRGITL